MRILHVTDFYLPKLGGIELHVRDLVAAQRAAGHDARVVTVTPGPDEPGVTRIVHDALPALLRRTRPDVVHAHVSVVSPFATRGTRQAADLGIPVLATVHSLWYSAPGAATLARTLLHLDRRRVLWSAVSTRAAEPLAAALGTEPLVLPNAVDTSFWPVPHRAGSATTVVSVGRLNQRKRPLPLLRMLRTVRSRLPDTQPLRAVIVGDGPRRAGLERYVARHRMGDWVELTGPLSREEIRALYATASVYVAPATLESFGIAALEARCAGVPVVASSRSGVGEFVTHGLDGLLTGSDELMVDAIERLVVDSALRERIAGHNRAVVPPFDWATARDASLAAYAQAAALLAGHGKAGGRTLVTR